LQVDEPALLRVRDGMGNFIRKEEKHGENSGDSKLDHKAQLQAVAAGVVPDEDDEVLPNYYQVMNGVPELPYAISYQENGEPAGIDEDLL